MSNNYESYADVLESYMIAEEGIISSAVKGAVSGLFTVVMRAINKLIEVIGNIRRKLRDSIRNTVDKVNDATGRTKFKNGDEFLNKISRDADGLSNETLSQYRVVVNACKKGEYNGYKDISEIEAYSDGFSMLYEDYTGKPIAFSRKTKQSAATKLDTATNILNQIKKYADSLKSVLDAPSGTSINIITTKNEISLNKKSATVYFKELQECVIPAWKGLITCLNFIADH